jgi:hypothetical protein
MSDAEKIANGLAGFVADMKAKGIHVGMGATPRCVTCGGAWPCAASESSA